MTILRVIRPGMPVASRTHRQCCRTIIPSPESGRRLPDFPQLPHREVVVGNYRVVYRYDPERDVVNIVMVVHGARLLKKPPDQDEHP